MGETEARLGQLEVANTRLWRAITLICVCCAGLFLLGAAEEKPTTTINTNLEVRGNLSVSGDLTASGKVLADSPYFVPVGSIIPYYDASDDADAYKSLPREWVLCDGNVLDGTHPRGFKESDVAQHLWGKRAPNMAGRFPRGIEREEKAGVEGGSDDLPDHVHKMPAHSGPVSERADDPSSKGSDGNIRAMYLRDNGEFGPRQFKLDREGVNINGNGNHSHSLPATLGIGEPRPTVIPRYVGMKFIMRIK